MPRDRRARVPGARGRCRRWPGRSAPGRAAAERVSRTISVHVARASIRSVRRAACRSGPNSPGRVSMPTVVSTAATGHVVRAPATTPAVTAITTRRAVQVAGRVRVTRRRRLDPVSFAARRTAPYPMATVPTPNAVPHATAAAVTPNIAIMTRPTTRSRPGERPALPRPARPASPLVQGWRAPRGRQGRAGRPRWR